MLHRMAFVRHTNISALITSFVWDLENARLKEEDSKNDE